MKLYSAIIAAVVCWAGVASADTPLSVWERAREPERADDAAVHAQAMARLYSVEREGTDDGSFFSAPLAANNDGIMRGVIALLLAAGAETSKNPLLRFDLAHAYEFYGEREHDLSAHQRAAALYKSAIAEFPNYERVDDAWSNLGQACAHIADRECEVRSWHEVLRRQTQDTNRVTPTLNLAEVEMHNGDLKTAIEDYRDSFQIATRLVNGTEEAILAEFGLAVALDRAGEINEAQHEAKLAVDMEKGLQNPNILHSEGVYFVPAYEVNWYDGLAAASVAHATTNPKLRADAWQFAVKAFTEYVKGGEQAKDKWLPIAKARLATYIAESAKAEKQLKATPPPAPEGPNGPLGPAPQVHNPGSSVIHL